MDLCLEVVWFPGARVLKRWREQEVLDLEEIQEADRAAEAEMNLGRRWGRRQRERRRTNKNSIL